MSLIYLLVPFGSPLFDSLSLRQSEPFQVITWLTGNLSHSDGNHLFWNLAALLLLGFFIEQESRWLMLCALLVGFVAIDIWFFIQTRFQQYVGLSGALNTILVCALYTLRKPGHWLRGNEILWLVLLLAFAKNGYEYATHSALFSNTRWPTTPSFHIVGMLAGCGLVCLWWRLRFGKEN
ncbi:rhomboid family intramembrane serine protease [Halioxenophilus sp. WMMB6]|uniref:rhomboid family intramembrane serine protease n=1 Tax=Halioxenophilus sp. WMMB6 TaxID=3073815 RepID=UPI00295E6A5F|nr:rhomboid family intramembrane serine protease [Halioxenophilus sp. WMMB6]